MTGLNLLATLKKELDELENVTSVLKLLGDGQRGARASTTSPPVINGCSDLFIEVFGEKVGRHARSAVGMAELPFGMARRDRGRRGGAVSMPTAEGLYYEEAGQGEPLLMVQGLGTDHFGWILQVPELSKHYRVITFDNRDVGQSKQADGAIRDRGHGARCARARRPPRARHVPPVGMSMGGAIAQEMALQAQERLRTLTLVVTFAGGGNWAAERARLWSEIRGLIDRDTHLDWLLLYGHVGAVLRGPRAHRLLEAADAREPAPAAGGGVPAPGRGERPARDARPPAARSRSRRT